MARSSTPNWDSAQAAAILPGVPLPDWAVSHEPFLPEVTSPSAASASAALPATQAPEPVAPFTPEVAAAAKQATRDLALDELSIVEMEAAFRELLHRPEQQDPQEPIITSTEEIDEPESAPVEFARPGYPQEAVNQVPMPTEIPGYPTDAQTGAIIVPPPPPAPALQPTPAPPSVALESPVVPQDNIFEHEPIRLDLPMSAVLAREFTRTSRTTHETSLPQQATPPAPAYVAPVPVAPVPVAPAPVAPVSVEAPIAPASDLVTPDEVMDQGVATEPAKQSRRLLILIACGALLALVAAAAAFFLPGILNPTDTATPSPTPTSNPTTIATSGFVLTTPKTIGQYTRMAGPIDSTLHQATSASVIPGLHSPISAVYGIGEVPHATVIAWKASTTPAPSSVSQAFAGFQSSAKAAVTDIAGVSSTGLPGQMSCGETQINGTPTTLCFWADPSTFGSITVVNPKTSAEGALTAAQIRSAVEVQQ